MTQFHKLIIRMNVDLVNVMSVSNNLLQNVQGDVRRSDVADDVAK